MANPIITGLVDKMQRVLTARTVCREAEAEQREFDSNRDFHMTDREFPPHAVREAIEEYEEAAKEFETDLDEYILTLIDGQIEQRI